MWLVMLPLENLFRSHAPWTAGIKVMGLGLVSGFLAGLARVLRGTSPTRLAASTGWAVLSAVLIGGAVSLLLYVYSETGSILTGLVGVSAGFLLVFAPAIAGSRRLPPHAAIVESLKLARYVWAVLAAYAFVLAVVYGLEYIASTVTVLPGNLLQAAVLGGLCTLLVMFVSSRSGVAETAAPRGASRWAAGVAQAAQNLLLAYALAAAYILILHALPDSFLAWDPLFGKWNFFWRASFAGTTGNLVILVSLTVLLVCVTRGPLWQRLVAVIFYRWVDVVTFQGTAWLLRFTVPVVLGFVFFACVALLCYQLLRYVRRPGTIPA